MAYHDEYLELVSAALDGALSPEEQARLDAHLDACPDCKALYDQLWVGARAVKGLAPQEPPADLTDRIMAAVAKDNVVPITAAPRRKQPWKKWMATAAVLAVIVAGGYGFSQIRMGGSGKALMAPAMQEIAAPAALPDGGKSSANGAANDTAQLENDEMPSYSYAADAAPRNDALEAAPENVETASAKQFSSAEAPEPAQGSLAEPAEGDTTSLTLGEGENWYGLRGVEPGEGENTGDTLPEGAIVTSFAVTGGGEEITGLEGFAVDTITVTVNGQTFEAVLNDSPAARALRETLPLTLDMTELNGNEKFAYLDFALPAEAQAVDQLHTGDLMLYGNNCLVLFYDSFPTVYSYTPLGALTDPAGLSEVLGSGDVTVTFTAE